MNLIDALFCQDCAMVIANDDWSGICYPAAHRERMDATLKGAACIDGDADLGFYFGTCAGCGIETATDQWFSGWVEEITTPEYVNHDDHEHCPLHGCVEYVCCAPRDVTAAMMAVSG